MVSKKNIRILEQRLKTKTVDGHTLIARALKRLGVTHVYGIGGTPIRETFGACVKTGIRHIGAHGQQAAAMMSMAQNYMSGKITSAVILSAGPAVTNAVTAALTAKDNHWPLILMGGRRPVAMKSMGSFQELDAARLFEPITKWSALIKSVDDIPRYLQKAFYISGTGRPGPVYIDISEDALTHVVPDENRAIKTKIHHPCPDIHPPDAAVIQKASDMLMKAGSPLMIIGKGVRWSEPYEELLSLAHDFKIPFITSPMGQGYIPDHHPMRFNAIKNFAQSKADMALVVGTRLDWTFRFGAELPREAKLIHIDLDDAGMETNRFPDAALTGDIKSVLKRLLKNMQAGNRDPSRPRRMKKWHDILREKQKTRTREMDSRIKSKSIPMSPYHLIHEIKAFLPKDAICAIDGGVILAAAQECLPTHMPGSRFTSGSNGCLGVGIPFGMGAKLACPDRPVVVLCGDAAFGFSVMEMETAARHDIPIIVVIANNNGPQGALFQETIYPKGHERSAMFLPEIHYEKIMGIFGGHMEFVTHPEQLRPAMARAASSGRPSCVNVRVDPRAPYPKNTF
ncbi:conserved hypothetical protein [Candidatus Desulfarcum epimagneticum]|uniref:Acetolactate synthase n=1 Tax=uncultured Desulfobacteraceae bacterium TaxID=218296 RepID=A0A484HHL3_9BACT|nr:conserved hypothetical protein [uncultured Desulfobacteraceae bacterium]